MRFDPNRWESALFAFHKGRARPAEWVKHNVSALDVEALKILPHKMWGKRQNKPIPLVRGTVLWHQLVRTSIL